LEHDNFLGSLTRSAALYGDMSEDLDIEASDLDDADKDGQRDEVKTVIELAGLYHNHDLSLPTRTIYMGGGVFEDGSESGVDAAMAESVIKNLDILANLSQDDITIIENNVGGDEYHGAAIYDAIVTCPCPVTIKVRGHAMSMGSIILQAAGRRVMGPTATQMLHYGTWGVNHHSKTAWKIALEGKRWDEWMEELYLHRIRQRHPDFPMSRLRKMLDHDTYLTATQSIELGLADEIG
jgi:ATP-dependent protease ClpP protease subunit